MTMIAQRRGQPNRHWPRPLKLYPAGDDHFFLVDDDVDVSFAKDPRGRVVEMRSREKQKGVAKR